MKILSINTESSSLKFSLFDMKDESVIATGLFERIGMDGSLYNIKYQSEKISQEIELNDFNDAVRILLEKLMDLGLIKTFEEIDGVGCRIINGKDQFINTTFINEDVVKQLEEMKDFVPLHNTLSIRAFMKYLPTCPMVAIFDTAFYQTMDEGTYLYPVPYKWYKDYGIRKYGFYGTAHRYIMNSVKDIVQKNDF